MKLRYVRADDHLVDEAQLVVRGGRLDPLLLRRDAERMHHIYGVFGISVFAVRDATIPELAQQPPLVRFRELSLMTVGVLRAGGFRLEPTGRNLATSRLSSPTSASPCVGCARWSTRSG
jgi:hypothetical protein